MTTLGIFVKHPVGGRVKTRLAEKLGAERAAEASAAFIGDLVRRFSATAEERALCFAPHDDAAKAYFDSLAGGDYFLWPQPDADLGERMKQFFEQRLHEPGDRVVVIGSDSPTLPKEFVQHAFTALRSFDCVLGPATDGGYYLLGMRGRCLPLFEAVDWSTPDVLTQTMLRIKACDAAVSLLPPWYDVDTFDDWRMLEGHVRALAATGTPTNLEQTRRVLGLDTGNTRGGL